MPGDSATTYLNTRGTAQHTYDAIVIGSGISGGWAAKELCDRGLKTLLLERGRDVVHLKDYPTATKAPWESAAPWTPASGSGKRQSHCQPLLRIWRSHGAFFCKRQRTSLHTGKALRLDTRLPGGRQKPCSGQDKHSAGARTISKVPRVMALRSIGPSATKTLRHGIAM